jgi:hypothetical protein
MKRKLKSQFMRDFKSFLLKAEERKLKIEHLKIRMMHFKS